MSLGLAGQGKSLGPDFSLSPWARGAILAFAAALLLACTELPWRLGLPAAWDEVALYSRLQAWREGESLAMDFGRGFLAHHWLAFSLLPSWSGPFALRMAVLLAFSLESWLLWRFTRGLEGERAAFGAVLVNSVSALTLGRLQATLGWVMGPLWILAAFSMARESSGRLLPLACGFFSAWLLCDYEPLALAIPGLALLLWARRKEGPAAAFFALGFLAGLGAVALSTASSLSHLQQVRGGYLRGGPGLMWWKAGLNGLKGFFFGQAGPGERMQPALALWALPLAAAGFPRLKWPLRLGLLLGLLPLAVPTDLQLRRAVEAWPFLCMAAGLGFSRVFASLRAPALRKALIAFACLGCAVSGLNFKAWRAAMEIDAYDYGMRLWRAAKAADKALREGRASGVLSELNFRPMGAFRIFQSLPGDPSMGKAWVLVSSEQTGSLPPPGQGAWKEIRNRPDLSALWLLQPRQGSQALWASRAAEIGGWQRRLERLPGLEQLAPLNAALSIPGGDPFLRSVLLDKSIFLTEVLFRGWPKEYVEWVLSQKELSVRQCLAMAWAVSSSEPRRALALVERALKMDPSRESAWRLRAELKARIEKGG